MARLRASLRRVRGNGVTAARAARDRDAALMTTATASLRLVARRAARRRRRRANFPPRWRCTMRSAARRGAADRGAASRLVLLLPSPCFRAALAQNRVRARGARDQIAARLGLHRNRGDGRLPGHRAARGRAPRRPRGGGRDGRRLAQPAIRAAIGPRPRRRAGGVPAPRRPGAPLAAHARDYTAPSQRDIRRAVRFIGRHVARAAASTAHHNAGRGRSAVCALAYIMEANGIGAQEAYARVAKQRRITPLPTRLCGRRVRSGARCGARRRASRGAQTRRRFEKTLQSHEKCSRCTARLTTFRPAICPVPRSSAGSRAARSAATPPRGRRRRRRRRGRTRSAAAGRPRR